MKMLLRKIHRWLGLLLSIQVIAWMLSGLYFSLYPIAEIRGEHLTRAAEPVDAAGFAGLDSPRDVVAALDRHFGEPWSLESIGLVKDGDATLWRISGSVDDRRFTRLVDKEGRVREALSEPEALAAARRWLAVDAEPGAAEWVDELPAGSEFRGGRLPAWRITFAEPEALHLYLDPFTGEVLARRTQRWRVFDFFWMLHIMDFGERDDFNHPLLQVAAAIGLAVAVGGVLLWAATTGLLRRRRARPPAG